MFKTSEKSGAQLSDGKADNSIGRFAVNLKTLMLIGIGLTIPILDIYLAKGNDGITELGG